MEIEEKRTVQKIKTKNSYSLLVVIPKIVAKYLGIKKGQNLIFKNEENRIFIDKESK